MIAQYSTVSAKQCPRTNRRQDLIVIALMICGLIVTACAQEKPPRATPGKTPKLDADYGPLRKQVTTVDVFERRLVIIRPVREKGQLRLGIKSQTRTIFVNVQSQVIDPVRTTRKGRVLKSGHKVSGSRPKPKGCYYCFRLNSGWYRPFLAAPNRHISKVKGKILKSFPWKPFNGPLGVRMDRGLLSYRIKRTGPGTHEIILRPIAGVSLQMRPKSRKISEKIRVSLVGVKKIVRITLWQKK